MSRHPGARLRGDRGAVVVESTLVVVVLVVLFLAVFQVGLYVHVRNVVVASAAEGAREAAGADVADASLAAARTEAILRSTLGSGTVDGLRVTSTFTTSSGVPVVEVQVRGAVPTVFEPVGDLLPLTASARALKEGAG